MRERATALLSFLGILWIVWLLHQIFPAGIGMAGIVPRRVDGLQGIITAPFLHLSIDHLLANSIPLLILGALIVLRGSSELLYVIIVTGLISSLGIWVFGAPGTMHFGASGIVFGFIGFLLFRGIFERKLRSILAAIVVAALYGQTLLASFMPEAGISWSGHIWGFIGGIAAARWRHPPRAYHRARMIRGLVVFFALFTAPFVFAGEFELGAQHVVVMQTGDTGEVDLPLSRGFAATGEWFFSERVSTHFAATFINPEAILFPHNPPPNDVDLGTLGLDTYSVTARYHLRTGARFSPYVGAGAGYVVIGNLEDRFGEDLEATFDAQLAPIVEAGVRYRVRPSIFLDARLSYMAVRAETNVVLDRDPRVDFPSELALNPITFSIGFGVRWR